MDAADASLLEIWRRPLTGGTTMRVRCPTACGYEFQLDSEGWSGIWNSMGLLVSGEDHTDDQFAEMWGDCWAAISRKWRQELSAGRISQPPHDHSEPPPDGLPQSVVDHLAQVRSDRVHHLLQSLPQCRTAGPIGDRRLYQSALAAIDESYIYGASGHGSGNYRVRVQVRVDVIADRAD